MIVKECKEGRERCAGAIHDFGYGSIFVHLLAKTIAFPAIPCCGSSSFDGTFVKMLFNLTIEHCIEGREVLSCNTDAWCFQFA